MRISWKKLQENKNTLKCLHCNSTNVSFQTKDKCKRCANYISRYRLNSIQVQEMYESQDKKCYLCHRDISLEKKQKRADMAYVDHNHKTGKVRSILCHSCNTMIGYVENQEICLDKLKKYLVP